MIPTLLSLRKLSSAADEHFLAETAIVTRFAELLPARYRAIAKGRTNRISYLQKNFFSSLFLSIYAALGIPAERRLFYGQINHCLRGLVTATDNLLDDEYKEVLPLNFPAPAIRFKSVMHILCFDRILEQIARQAVRDGLIAADELEPLLGAIFQAMLPIGAEEAIEEGGVTTILTPLEVLNSVHMFKGGKLLCLALVAPLLLERQRQEALKLAETGVFQIGMALQVIDDLTDFYEDIAHRNHNYLLSTIEHQGPPSERQALAAILRGGPGEEIAVEILFPISLTIVMARTIGEALAGFAALEQAGYWYKEKQAIRIIKALFVIRQVEHLLPFFPKPSQRLRLSISEVGR